MRRVFICAICLLWSGMALADEKTVTLTQSELQQVIAAEALRALFSEASQKAKPAYDKINAAFAPEKEPSAPK